MTNRFDLAEQVNRESQCDDQRGKKHVWRIYDYPHVVLLYLQQVLDRERLSRDGALPADRNFPVRQQRRSHNPNWVF